MRSPESNQATQRIQCSSTSSVHHSRKSKRAGAFRTPRLSLVPGCSSLLLGFHLDDLLGLGDLDVHYRLFLVYVFRGLVVGLYDHLRAVGDLAAQDHLAHGVLDHALQHPLEGSGAERRIVALFGELVQGLGRELYAHVALDELLAEALYLDLDDVAHVLALELVEHDDLVDPVQELGTEDLAQLARNPTLHLLVGESGVIRAEAQRLGLVDGLRPDVGGHDEDHVLEVHRTALRVGELPVLQDLQHDVEDVRVGLLDLVEENDAVGTTPDLLRELSTLVVADVAGRRTNESAHRVALHVLGHVEPDHGVLITEEVLGEGPRKLGLAHARRPEEHERAGWPVRVLDTGESTTDGTGDGLDGLVLPDDAAVQSVLHLQEARGLFLGHLLDRDARPHRDDLGDLVLSDGDALLLDLALTPGLLQLAALGDELALGIPEARGLLELLAVDGGFLLGTNRGQFLVYLLVVGRRGHGLDPHLGCGLVHEVDGLVRQEAVRDVAVAELRGGLQGLVCDVYVVVRLVLLAQTLEDEFRLLDRRLADLDGLEAALQGLVLLHVLAVLVDRRRADDLDLTPRQRRLENRSRVYRALGGTCTDEVVDLVDEQDDVAVIGDLLHYLLEALLELAAVLGAGDQGAEIERVDLFVAEDLGHLALGDLLREPLDDGGLADAGLTYNHRVVLGAPDEDLHDPRYLLAPADDGIQLVLLGVGREVPAVLVELAGLGPLGLDPAPAAGLATAPAATAAAPEPPADLAPDLVRVDGEVGEGTGRRALALQHEADQGVLGADVVVAQRQSLPENKLQHYLRAWRERSLRAGAFLAVADDALDLLAHLVEVHVQGIESLRGDALVLAQKAEEQVLRAYVVVVEMTGLVLREHHDLAGPLRETFEH